MPIWLKFQNGVQIKYGAIMKCQLIHENTLSYDGNIRETAPIPTESFANKMLCIISGPMVFNRLRLMRNNCDMPHAQVVVCVCVCWRRVERKRKIINRGYSKLVHYKMVNSRFGNVDDDHRSWSVIFACPDIYSQTNHQYPDVFHSFYFITELTYLFMCGI